MLRLVSMSPMSVSAVRGHMVPYLQTLQLTFQMIINSMLVLATLYCKCRFGH